MINICYVVEPEYTDRLLIVTFFPSSQVIYEIT